jgi:hypothetical protein
MSLILLICFNMKIKYDSNNLMTLHQYREEVKHYHMYIAYIDKIIYLYIYKS